MQYAVLRALWEEDGRSGAAIGVRLAIDSATTAGVIDRLEAAGLVSRQPDDRDRRIHRAVLSERGRALQAALDSAMVALNAEIAADMGPDEAAALWAALRRLGGVGI